MGQKVQAHCANCGYMDYDKYVYKSDVSEGRRVGDCPECDFGELRIEQLL